jgi:hypothetical protein
MCEFVVTALNCRLLPPNELISYWPISLLPIVSEVVEKLLLNRLLQMAESSGFIPNHQFGYTQRHSTID